MANISIVHTETHDETKPAGTRARSLGDDDIREKDRMYRERLAIDHVFLADESGEAGIGIHKKVTMRILAADPTQYDDVGYVYLKTVSGVIELFYEDSAGTVTQLTSAGKILGDNVKWSNNTNIVAKNAAGSGTVNLIKANASDVPEVPNGAVLSSSAAPTTDAQIPNKKYVDDKVAAVPGQVGLGTFTDKSSNYAAQQVTKDTFIYGSINLGNSGSYIFATSPDNVVWTNGPKGTQPDMGGSQTLPILGWVPKNYYWRLTIGGTTSGLVLYAITNGS